jgi:hypothetical protein
MKVMQKKPSRKPMRSIIAIISAFLVFGSSLCLAETDSKQVWACAVEGSAEEDLFLVAWGARSYIKLYDTRVWGNQYQDGTDLRWDFGESRNKHYQFSVMLNTEGHADYYDFNSEDSGSRPSYRYQCRLAQS